MSKLFDENMGSAANPEQLAVLKKKFHIYHPAYVALASLKTRRHFRDWLESLWVRLEPYLDNNFHDEFKKQFNQRAWELYMGSVLLNRGYALEKHNCGPDFKIVFNRVNLWIEATAIEKGNGNDKVPDIVYGEVFDFPEKEILLRLSAGLRGKYEIYLKYLKDGVVDQNDPFVIAIDRSPVDHMDGQIPLILKCLFAIGHQVLFINTNGKHPKVEGSTWSTREKVSKVNGSEIGMLMFRDQCYEGVSAIIYSTNNILNSPHDITQLGNDLVIVHNPFAKNPLPDNYFVFGEVWKQVKDQIIKTRK